ncbi:MAG: ethanolamine utilization protein [Burkholderiaceae bacterium]|nr:ethanolamine utilization protein [Burkholderiaceae bacterium]
MSQDFPSMVFLDLETTGATATRDRITEIGIVEVSEHGVDRYSQLVNPQARIPEFIQQLTGITEDMVVDAPTFDQIARDLLDRINGKLFVAHNARFDYGFLKNEFKRVGIDFRARVLCTVKLSRALYPQESRHNLDSLIARHGLQQSGRHRALADADLIFQFWEKLCAGFSSDVLEQTIARLTARPALPSQLDPDLPEQLPETHGVYIFYGENNFPLYVGKSNNLRKRVMSHFAADHTRGKEMSLSMQVRRVDWIETAGEIAALLKESALIKELLPSHNTRLRRNKELCSWRIPPKVSGTVSDTLPVQAELVWARDLNLGAQPDLYGIFRSQRDALEMLSELARQEKLCKALLGLEKVAAGASCFGYQLKNCRGACIGKEKTELHHARLLMAMARHRIPAWPHPGPVGLKEAEVVHVVDAWCYLGTASREEELHAILETGQPVFDLDVYKILRKAMRQLPTVAL